jgi:hypothetical protein
VTGGGPREHERRVADLLRLVAALEEALERRDYREGRPVANRLAASTGAWIDEIQHDTEIEPELTASLKVFRNAAFAFRQLSKTSRSAKNVAMASTCETLIAQGRDVLQLYLDRRNEQGDSL